MDLGLLLSKCGLRTPECFPDFQEYVRSFPFQLHICVRTDFFHTLQPNNLSHKLNAEAVMRKQLSSIKTDTKEICKNVKQCHLKISYFS